MPSTNVTNVTVLAHEIAKKSEALAAQGTPPPLNDLKNKFRWLQCTLKNETQFDVLLTDTYFESGRYWEWPHGSMGEFEQTIFSCTNDDHTVLTGVAGGTAFRIVIDQSMSMHYDFAVGWSNPLNDSPSVSIVPGSHGIDGYKAINSKGGSFTDDTVYEAKDGDGRPVQFKLHFSSTLAGQEVLFVVKQIVLA
ncbi:hypothetical protein BN946_scf185000.g50 [Trametes cinnabarina]|uniref:Uncharacterized protein n=1 Tax=Pycnoporus cinnabarinus TaxID=5643 RepID=A0A060S3C4_PYCCI|nr:hypothetical protein BN946_scf185000.g50 [Trametes cinnabarina]